MPKEVNLTGEEVVALTKEYLTEEDVHLSIRPWSIAGGLPLWSISPIR